MRSFWLVIGLLLGGAVWAHNLGVFAVRDGDQVSGYVFVQGGGRLAGVEVRLEAGEEQVLASGETAADGRFVLTAAPADGEQVIAETVDGHRAVFAVIPALAAPAGQAHSHADEHAHSHEHESAESAAWSGSRAELEALVARAVSAQVRPLRELLIVYENRVRLTSIVGGIGYIFGIMGLILFFKARGRSQNAD